MAGIGEWEVWACAQQQVAQHKDRALEKIAERIGALELAGDEAGVATWKRIAAAAEQLQDFGGARPISRRQ